MRREVPTGSIHDFVGKNNPEKDTLAVLQYISDRKSVKNCCCSKVDISPCTTGISPLVSHLAASRDTGDIMDNWKEYVSGLTLCFRIF
jgi:hypothetical protein